MCSYVLSLLCCTVCVHSPALNLYCIAKLAFSALRLFINPGCCGWRSCLSQAQLVPTGKVPDALFALAADIDSKIATLNERITAGMCARDVCVCVRT